MVKNICKYFFYNCYDCSTFITTILLIIKISESRVSHRCWEHGEVGAPQNLIGGGSLSQNMRGVWRELKILSKNTCNGVHLIVIGFISVISFIWQLPAVSLQASKFTKNELFTHIFQGFQLDFKLLFIVLLLGIISWKNI